MSTTDPTLGKTSRPQSIAGSVLSIADKLDSIVGLFSVGWVPLDPETP